PETNAVDGGGDQRVGEPEHALHVRRLACVSQRLPNPLHLAPRDPGLIIRPAPVGLPRYLSVCDTDDEVPDMLMKGVNRCLVGLPAAGLILYLQPDVLRRTAEPRHRARLSLRSKFLKDSPLLVR